MQNDKFHPIWKVNCMGLTLTNFETYQPLSLTTSFYLHKSSNIVAIDIFNLVIFTASWCILGNNNKRIGTIELNIELIIWKSVYWRKKYTIWKLL